MRHIFRTLLSLGSHKIVLVAAVLIVGFASTSAYMLNRASHGGSSTASESSSATGDSLSNPDSPTDKRVEDKKDAEKKAEEAKKQSSTAKQPTKKPSSSGGSTSTTQPAPSAPAPVGGVWPPTPTSVGIPAGTSLTTYTGPCDIYTANTVIDKKIINCVDFRIMTTGVVITKSKINGAVRVGTQDDYEPTVISDPEGDDPIRLTLLDSEVDATLSVSSGFRPISSSHYSMKNSYVHGSYSGGECHNACTIENSYLHGFGEHSSGLRVLRNAVIRNNTIWCEPNPNSDEDLNGIPDPDGGCSGNMTMYEEFGVPHNNLIEHNYFPAGLFWYSLKFNGNDNGNIRIINNLFGLPKSGAYVADGWDVKPSNTWSGNTFTNGQVANP